MNQNRASSSVLLFLVAALALYSPTPLPAIIVAHWRLDSNTLDTQGTHPGTLIGTDYRWDTNTFIAGTAALRLNTNNASSTYVLVPDASDFRFGTNDFSVSYWVKKMRATTSFLDAYGVGKWKSGANPGTNEWTLDLSTGDKDNLPLFAIEAGTTSYAVSSAANLTIGTWAHLVAIRRTNTISLYLDGALQGRTVIPANLAVNNNRQPLYIGNSAALLYGANAFYDDVQIYNHALTDGGVSTNGQPAGGEVAYLWNNPGAEITSGPVIVSQPASKALVLTGGPPVSVTFTVLAAGTATLRYQWRFNNTPLLNATNASYNIASVTTNHFGYYDVLVTNNYGNVASVPARLSAPAFDLSFVPGLVVSGIIGSTVRLDYSTDMVNWTTLTTTTNLPSNPYYFADFSALGQPKRFYRAVFGP